jgi:hypothetical protein
MSDPIPLTEAEDIFDWAIRLSKRVAEVAAIKRERRKQNRRAIEVLEKPEVTG